MRVPTSEEAFEAFCTLLAFVGAQRAPELYDQRPGHLPSDAKSADSYRRRHRELRKAGIEGAYVRGKLLVCTADAWTSDLPRVARKSALALVPSDPLDTALGIRTRRRA